MNFFSKIKSFGSQDSQNNSLDPKPKRDTFSNTMKGQTASFTEGATLEVLNNVPGSELMNSEGILSLLECNPLLTQLNSLVKPVVEATAQKITKDLSSTEGDSRGRENLMSFVIGYCIGLAASTSYVLVSELSSNSARVRLGIEPSKLTIDDSNGLVSLANDSLFSEQELSKASEIAIRTMKLSRDNERRLRSRISGLKGFSDEKFFLNYLKKTNFNKLTIDNSEELLLANYIKTLFNVLGQGNEALRVGVSLICYYFSFTQSSAKTLDITITGKTAVDDNIASRIAETIAKARRGFANKRAAFVKNKNMGGEEKRSRLSDLSKTESKVVECLMSHSTLLVYGRSSTESSFSTGTNLKISKELTIIKGNQFGLDKDAKIASGTSFFDRCAELKEARSRAYKLSVEYREKNFGNMSDSDIIKLYVSRLDTEQIGVVQPLFEVKLSQDYSGKEESFLSITDRLMIETYLTPLKSLARLV